MRMPVASPRASARALRTAAGSRSKWTLEYISRRPLPGRLLAMLARRLAGLVPVRVRAQTWMRCPSPAPLASSSVPRRSFALLVDRVLAQDASAAAVVDLTDQGEVSRCFSYGDLVEASAKCASWILDALGTDDLRGQRVAYLCPPTFEYLTYQLGVWRAGGVCVPLCVSHPPAELAHVIRDSQCSMVIARGSYAEAATKAVAVAAADIRVRAYDQTAAAACTLPESAADDDRALIIYTSGTSGPPKGVVHTHASLGQQMDALHSAWGWSRTDRILNVLPLHHLHGVLNVVGGSLYAGATLEMLPCGPDPDVVWRRLASGDVTLFMAVPTIYARLIRHFESQPASARKALTQAVSRLRLMVSGSAALPETIMRRWQQISGHMLLERFGMTEVGMALSNPLEPIEDRRPGHVGKPLPGVQARITSQEDPTGLLPVSPGEPGELQVRGPAIFKEYWRKPELTAREFTSDGWFRTGDVAEINVGEDNSIRILGRASIDIIKCGGYKISALDIERVLLDHPSIDEVAVVGARADEVSGSTAAELDLGELVICAIVPVHGECSECDGGRATSAADLEISALREWAGSRLAGYKMPRRCVLVNGLPRNAMGKVDKKRLRKLVLETL